MWSTFLLLFLFFLLSCLGRNISGGHLASPPLDAERGSTEVFYEPDSTSCTRTTSAGENYVHQVSNGIEEVRAVTDPAGNLVDCAVSSSQRDVGAFMRVCRLGLTDQRATRGASESGWVSVAEAKSQCQAFLGRSRQSGAAGRSPEPNAAPRRSKRGFTYPGTLWCGAGNIADSYDHLGEFAETDSCCRIHDHCPYVIQAFSHNFGYTNFKWHSISHCDCDNVLKTCLRKVNDTASRVVGQAFFNVIEVPCFDFTYEEQCVERHWYGRCKRYDRVPVAVMKESDPYDFGGIDVIDELTLAPRAPKVKEDGDRSESTTTLPVSSPQSTAGNEPSIGRVVTAAEDFIKVLATVSTSHSSTTEAAKEEVQGTNRKNRKKKKKMDKKKKDSKKKGKGRKGKQRINTLSKVEEAPTMTSAGHKVEDVIDNSLANNPTFLRPKLDQNMNTFDSSLTSVGGEGALSNELMKDEPERQLEDRGKNVVTPTAVVMLEPEELDFHKLQHHRGKDHLTLTAPSITKKLFQAGRQKSKDTQKAERKITIPPDPTTPSFTLSSVLEGKQMTTGVSTSTSTTSPIIDIYVQQLEPQSFANHTKKTFLAPSMAMVSCLKRKKEKLKQKCRQKSRSRLSHSLLPFVSTLESPYSTSAKPEPEPTGDSTPVTDFNTVAEREFQSQRLQSQRKNTLLIKTSYARHMHFLKNKKQKQKDNHGQKRRRISLSTHKPNATKIQTTTSTISGTPTLSAFNIHSGENVELQRSESYTKEEFVMTTSAVPTVDLEKVRWQKGRRGRRRGRKVTAAFHNAVAPA